MDKDSLLTAITEFSASKRISKKEVLDAFARGQGELKHPPRHRLTLTNILYAIGGLIVAIGIFLFFEQRWDTLPSLARVLVTFGSGVAAYTTGIFLMHARNMKGVAFAFFLIFSIITPFGIYIALDEAHYHSPLIGYENIILGAMLIWVVASFFLLRLSIFRLLSVIFGSFLYFSATGALLEHNPVLDIDTAFEYRFLALGISYLLIGYGWEKAARILTQAMYAIGSAMFLGAALSLGGYAPSANEFWEIIYIGLNFGILFLSVALKSRFMLAIGSLFLMGYIMKMTAEYFSDSFGWPLSLIVSGFALIGIGYATFAINNKYIKQSSANPGE